MDNERVENRAKADGNSTSALWIAMLPFVGYVLAFSYEAGQARHFRVPIELIKPDLALVVRLTAAALFSGWLFLQLLDVAYDLLRDAPRTVIKWTPMIGLTVVFALMKTSLVVLLVPVIFVALLEFAFPLLSQRKVRGYRQKLLSQNELEASAPSINRDFLARGWPPIPLIIWGLFLCAIVAREFGAFTASNRNSFLVDRQTQEVVIGIWDDVAISRPLLEDGAQVYLLGTIAIRQISGRTYEERVLGPLRVQGVGDDISSERSTTRTHGPDSTVYPSQPFDSLEVSSFAD
jgi:hypothetical protein